jgi:DNA polymerase III subunit gamma/tau
MSYQVLARKWRPKNFQQLIGQEHVVTVLTNALVQQRLHHAYLFTGTRGVGKTTIARIFAKSLNCQQGISATPCGVCDVCQDIDQGRFIDLLEIDAASRTKVDDTREILDNVQYAPSRGRYKVYLIDEVHMLSRSSFNALLKTLEEPPEHVKFILATTDPQKLPITVLSRCLQFHLKALTRVQIETKLTQILQAEQIVAEAGSLMLLAKAGRGSMRDALSLTDQAIAQGQITVANVQQMLGGVDHHWPYKLLIHLIKQDSAQLMQQAQEIASYAPNYARLFAEFLQLLHQVAMLQLVPKHFEVTAEQAQLLEKFARAMSPEDVQLYYQILLKGRKDLPYGADEQVAFEMVLLRLMAFKPMVNGQVVSAQTDSASKPLPASEITSWSADALPDSQLNRQTEPIATIKQDKVSDDIAAKQMAQSLADSNDSETSDEQVSVQHRLAAELSSELLQIEQQAVEQGFSSDTKSNATAMPFESEQHAEKVSDETVHYSQSLFEPADDMLSEQELTQQHQAEVVYQHQVLEHNGEYASLDPAVTSLDTASVVPNNALKQAATDDSLDPIAAAISTRNMLRSRKKQLGQTTKKSSDANVRQPAQPLSEHSAEQASATSTADKVKQTEPEVVVRPSIAPPEQEFTPELINPAQHKYANQVDRWAHMIDAMSLGGRLKQLAIHATIDEQSAQNKLILYLDQCNKHLLNDNAQQQLQQQICQYLQQDMQLEINLVAETVADPFAIQAHIDDKRQHYARDIIEQDELVQALQHRFQASINEDSIKAR